MVELRDGAEAYSRAFSSGLEPDPRLTLSEWAERYRFLSGISASEPGPYRFARTPYWREPSDCLSAHSPVSRVTIMKGAQVGATELGNNWLGYVVDAVPGPFLLVSPTEDLAKKISRQRLDPMFRDSPRLRGKIHASKARDGSSSVLLKMFPGGVVSIIGANSGTGFRSMPARYLMLDEIDAYPIDVGDEGDPVALAERATRTFSNSKQLVISTPTIDGRSRIQTEFERGDRRYYHVPCPLCGELHRFEWGYLEYDDDDPDGVVMRCPHCEGTYPEAAKLDILARGVWIPEEPDRSDSHRSYHLSALYSPLGWRSWADIVRAFLKGKKNPVELRNWVNLDLGETWKEKGEQPEWKILYLRRETYPVGRVPEGGLVLTCGVDIQKDRIELEVVAHGAPEPGALRGETWSVDYVVLPGAPTDPNTWTDLSDYLARTFLHPSGAKLRISRTAVDSGYSSQEVYRWGRRQPLSKVMVIKGSVTPSVVLPQPRAVDVKTTTGRRLKRGIKLWTVGVGILKEELYGCLNLPQPLNAAEEGYPPGYCHFPEWPESYFQQLTAERLVRKVRRGYSVYEWELPVGVRNEALDVRVYAMAAAESLGLSRWSPGKWASLQAQVGAKVTEGAKPPAKRTRRRGKMKGLEWRRDSR